MRAILFRGKRIDNGEWVYGGCAVTENQVYLIYNQAHSIDLQGFTVDENTIGQYTGLADKNGKRIFEGDVYTRRDDYVDYHACVICFGDYFDGYANRYATMAHGFYVKPLDGGTYNFAGAGYSEIEISGNIHDNPELLEVGE